MGKSTVHDAREEIVVNYHYKGFNPRNIGQQACPPGHAFGPHVRDYWLLHYVASGHGIFKRGGETLQLGPGDIFVIPPYEETYYEADMIKPWHYIWIGFTAEEILPPVADKYMIHCPAAGGIFEDMLRCAKLEQGRSAFLAGKIWELFAVFLEQDGPETDYIKKAVSYMNTAYVNGITIKQVAERVNLDRSYFSTVFKEQMGIPPQDYLIRLRLEKAAELLTVYGESPTTAGISVGYPDLYHFSKIFKKYYGVSPRTYQADYLLRGAQGQTGTKG